MLEKSTYAKRLAERNDLDELDYESEIILKLGDIICRSNTAPTRVSATGWNGFSNFRYRANKGFIVDERIISIISSEAILEIIKRTELPVSIWRKREVIHPYCDSGIPQMAMNKTLTNPVTSW